MRRHPSHLICLFLLLLVCLPPLPAADGADDNKVDMALAKDLVAKGVIKPFGLFLDVARRIQPGQMVDAYLHFSREHGFYEYEVYILDNMGEVWEIEFNAETGKLIEHGREID